MTQFFNRRDEKAKRQRLRSQMPTAERILWSRLKGRQLHGCRFRRQYSIGPYVVDFYSPQVKLAIELDGETHYVGDAAEYDSKRQQFIESFGIRVLRFLNDDVYENLDGVWEAIARAVKERLEPTTRNPATRFVELPEVEGFATDKRS